MKILISIFITLVVLFLPLGYFVWAPEVRYESVEVEESEDETLDLVRLFFVGDIMMDRGVLEMANRHGEGDLGFIFNQWDLWESEDIVFGNLEGLVSDRGADLGGLYSFRMPPVTLEVLREEGFDVLSVANNHAGDWGREAFVDTLHRLQGVGMLHPGGGLTRDQAIEPEVSSVSGLTIGWLGFTDTGPNWLEVGSDKPGILLAADQNREEIISEAAEGVDLLVVSYHFGEEYEPQASSRQRYLAESSIEAGARLVIGHHPHVIQEVERYEDGLIAYSLGNFVFDQYFSEETMTGLVLEVEVAGSEIISVKKHISRQDEFYRPVFQNTTKLD